MKIGIPQALLYYRYGVMWKTFFECLDSKVVISQDTNQSIMSQGVSGSVGECCLPVKLFLGHTASLLGGCDRILVPRFEQFDKSEEFCVRFWGLPDIVCSTFPEATVLSYNLQGQKPGSELLGFLHMGREMGRGWAETLRAYMYAREKQRLADSSFMEEQRQVLRGSGLKVLLAVQPYIIHDSYIGAPIVRMIREQGAEPIFADRCDRMLCRGLSREISTDLYWTMNKEILGAIPLLKGQVDGVIMITAFPCGTDSLANELALRRIRDIPITQIVLDEQQGEAGLQTRIECFLDILKERRRTHAS